MSNTKAVQRTPPPSLSTIRRRQEEELDSGDRDRGGNDAAEGDGSSTPRPYDNLNFTMSDFPETNDGRSREQVVKDYKVMVEYKWLKRQAPSGVYVIPSPTNLREWHGVIFLRRAMYGTAIFKFRIDLPLGYNDVNVYPRVYFISPVFNPFIHPQTGELDVKGHYPNWNPDKHYVVTVLTLLKKIFYMKDKDIEASIGPNPYNPEAAHLYRTDRTEYLRRAEECVARSQENVYAPDDGSLLHFTESKPAHTFLLQALHEVNERIQQNTEPGSESPVPPRRHSSINITDGNSAASTSSVSQQQHSTRLHVMELVKEIRNVEQQQKAV